MAGEGKRCLRQWEAVLRVMRQYGLLFEIRRLRSYYRSSPYRRGSYGNQLQQDLHAQRPNEKWVTDITYIHIEQGRLYLSVIKDLYDRSIVAYEMAQYLDEHMVLHSVEKAAKLCKGTIQHSDQGAQYVSNEYAQLAKRYQFSPLCPDRALPWTMPQWKVFSAH